MKDKNEKTDVDIKAHKALYLDNQISFDDFMDRTAIEFYTDIINKKNSLREFAMLAMSIHNEVLRHFEAGEKLQIASKLDLLARVADKVIEGEKENE